MDPKINKPASSQGEAVQRATIEHLQKKFPQLSEEIATSWTREIMSDNKGEKSEDLKMDVTAARDAYRQALKPTEEEEIAPVTLRDSAFPAQPENPEEIQELRSYLDDPKSFMSKKEDIKKLIESIESQEVSPSNKDDLREQAHKALIEAAKGDDFQVVQQLLLRLGTRGINEGLVSFEAAISETLEDLIEAGKLERAKDLAHLVQECKAAGYWGISYEGQLDRLAFFQEALREGLRIRLENKDKLEVGFPAMDYVIEAKQYGIDVSDIINKSQSEQSALSNA